MSDKESRREEVIRKEKDRKTRIIVRSILFGIICVLGALIMFFSVIQLPNI